MGLSEVFWSFLITSLIGGGLALSRLCYKSKCSNIEIGLSGIRIIRDTVGEEKLDEITAQHPLPSSNEEKV
jgi:hypothetical protein